MADSSTAGFIALGLLGLSTVPTLKIFGRALSRRRIGHEGLEKLYEDEDGIATIVSQRAFSTALQTYFLLGGTSSGLCLSIATAVQSTVQTTTGRCVQVWLAVACWVSLARIQKRCLSCLQ